MTVLGHAVLFESEFTMQKHGVGEDSDAVAPLVGAVLKNPSQRCRTGMKWKPVDGYQSEWVVSLDCRTDIHWIKTSQVANDRRTTTPRRSP